jgi:hypothetical protein
VPSANPEKMIFWVFSSWDLSIDKGSEELSQNIECEKKRTVIMAKIKRRKIFLMRDLRRAFYKRVYVEGKKTVI